MPQEVMLGEGQEGVVVAALGSHFELLAKLLNQAAASDGLQALCTPLLASSEQLSRGLEECDSPGREQSPEAAKGEITSACGPGDSGDARPAYELKGPENGPHESPRPSEAIGPAEAPERQEKDVVTTNTYKSKTQEWAEDQIELEGLRESRTPTAFLKSPPWLPKPSPWLFRRLRDTVGNARYEIFWAALVMVNTFTIILEVEWTGIRSGNRIGVYEKYGSEEYMDQWWPSGTVAFFAIDCVFSLMFTVELMLTFTHDIWNWQLGFAVSNFRPPFWKNPLDWLDLVIVISSNIALLSSDGPYTDTHISSSARFFRIFRLVRILRLVRLMRKLNSLDPLHLMTTAMRGSLAALAFSILLLLLIQTLFAMVINQVLWFGWLSDGSSLSDEVRTELFKYFGTFTRSMVTMFELLLANYTTVLRFLMDNVHETFGYVVLLYKLTVGVAVVGVINGVFIQETFSVAQNDEFIMVRKRIRQMEHHKQTITPLFMMADRDASGTLTRGELSKLLQKDFIRAYMEAMDIRCADHALLFHLIAGDADEVSVDDFIAGIARLKGFARNIDVISVLETMNQNQKGVMHDLQRLIEDIEGAPKKRRESQLLDGA